MINAVSNPLLTEMQGLSKEAAGLSAVQPPKGDFEALLTNTIAEVNGLQKTSSDLATRLELGDSSVTLAQTMIAKEKAGVAFEATVQVRNKLVEAYKEIMNMPV